MKSPLLIAVLALWMAGTAALQAEPAVVAGYSFVKSLGGIEEYRLDANGLTVLIAPDHSAPPSIQKYRLGCPRLAGRKNPVVALLKLFAANSAASGVRSVRSAAVNSIFANRSGNSGSGW